MSTEPTNPSQAPVVKIIAVGTAGLNALEHIATTALPGVTLVAINTDSASLASSSATEKIVLEPKRLQGLGTGGDPERGRAVAEENLPRLKEACAGAQVVFLLTGLGGGAGTGITPVLARLAKEAGALVIAFVALPFDCEGSRRRRQAQQGLEHLKAAADGVICLPNQKVFKLIDENTSLLDTFKRLNELLTEGVCGVWRLFARKGLLEIHFADLCALLRNHHGESSFATAEASGASRSREVLDKLFAHPMLDGGKMLADAEAVLVSLTGGSDLAMSEINRVMEHINAKCERAQVIMGAALDEAFRERLAITLITVRREEPAAASKELGGRSGTVTRETENRETEPVADQMLEHTPTVRPHSRFVPPPPSLPPEKIEKLLAGQTGGRPRKGEPRLRQTQLPLEIISKGRFDKSEPTIHKGEDLDVPTYIRRGVALN